ncbi:putative cardiolipin-specific deacylase, mitochondrial [Erysiphe neolycopersici]|uniref:Putative cardiolipin-specific deacylase, mitochondrial n=1 Tax=Erysiphe neolycopersici TaxID=212602 RepID=A0A420HVI2_9PEZI|nr:putative cardiolipin-specific deacylase, mitochondrial [Erysiphe neolycopersici]
MSIMRPNSDTSGDQATLAAQNVKMSDENRFKTPYFPLGYKTAAWQWWSNLSPAVTEHKVLSFVPFIQPLSSPTNPGPSKKTTEAFEINALKDKYGPRVCYSDIVILSGKDRSLNEFSVERLGEKIEQNLVMLHGYGAGLGFFYKNFEGLSRVKGWKIYALDMLGMGRSSRPPFKIHSKDQAGRIREAENWFIDALEEWRVKKNLEKFTLLGHSMGGYLAVAYALKYPGHLNKLILASPVGIPENPYATHDDLQEPEKSALTQEFTESQDETTRSKNLNVSAERDKIEFRSQTSEELTMKKIDAPSQRRIPKWFSYLWDANISPFSVIRWTGPLGPRLVSGWSSRRFSHLPHDESEALHEYTYSLFRQRGSGEYALSHILAPGAFARDPIIKRIHKVGRQEIHPKSADADSTPVPNKIQKETGFPIIFMYGENDWMDVAGGLAAEQKLKEEKTKILQTASEEERLRENGSSKVLIINNAGHHLYLDGWEDFNKILRVEMDETLRRGRHELGLL